MYDVVVVGAGPAGAATALRLARAGRSVLLLERSRFAEQRIGETLAPRVQPLLRELGAWDRFSGTGPLPSWGTRSVWDDAQPAEWSHVGSGYGSGWHVDRRAVDRMLADAARAEGAALRTGTAVVGAEAITSGWEVLGSDGARWVGRVLVDATGRGARIGRGLGGTRLAFDRLVAVAADWPGVDPANEEYLLVEAGPDGWWYTAPVPGGRMVGMLMTDADLCRRDGLADRTRWRQRLCGSGLTAARAGAPALSAGPRVHAAASHRLRRDDDARAWLAVGDAALAVDPVTGSGFLRALRSATTAAAAVGQLLDAPESGAATLARYESQRDRECTAYLLERARYYGCVRRFPTPFWSRRVQRVSPGRPGRA